MRRIDRLRIGLQHVAAGDLDYQVEINSSDEIGSLQRSFTDMESRLKQTIEEKDKFAGRLQQLAEEMRSLRDDAIRANKHKSEFLASMSHELRTPLNAIIGFSEVLKEKMFGELNEKQTEYAEDIHSSGHHLLSLINDILDLSKIEAGHMELNLTEFDIPSAIGDALTLIRERAGRHAITVESHIDESLGELVADERKFKQILLNLLSNATKFTPDGGKISVWAIRDGDSVRVSVKDTGIGISREDQDKIFNEFQQVGNPEEQAQEGTGLGLALTQTFVEMHGGSISVESEPGKGSTFTFNLPFEV
jgi:signal transduction histidine kinase